ncbi:MAG TPA: ROK family transcriptional regulator [Trebonia sp.]
MQSQGESAGAAQRPGTPSLLRELNDRAALQLLLDGRTLTRSQLSELTGVSKVTVAQMLARLTERGLVAEAGAQAGGRGPNATLYAAVPSSAYVAAMYTDLGQVSTAVADVTGKVIAEVRETVHSGPSGAGSAVSIALVRSAVDQACARAGISVDQLSAFVIGSPGVVDPRTGDPTWAFNLPEWHEGVLAGLRGELRRPVVIENDVNLAAMAERAVGAAAGADDFVLLWIGIGMGLATVLGGRLHRGVSGAAGEIGWLPVPGAPVTRDVRHPASGGLQWLAGAQAVRELAERYGFGAPDGTIPDGAAPDSTAAGYVRAAVAALPERGILEEDVPEEGLADDAPAGDLLPPAGAFLDELAHRIALGAAAVCAVLDPGLVVLGGEIGLAGGPVLASRVSAHVAALCPIRPAVVATQVTSDPVLRGALLTAVDQARADLLASVSV